MPFSGLNKATGLMDAIKYTRLDYQGEAIQPHMYKEACRYAQMPIKFGKPAVKALIRYLLHKEPKNNSILQARAGNNPMTSEQLEANALSFITGWKKQFQISDFDAPLTPRNREGRDYRINLMRELVDFCTERGYKPVYVIPPVTEHLSKYYTDKFQETYIYSFLRDVDRDVELLDYSKEKHLADDTLYFNSFFMNKKGASIFTERVLKSDINITATTGGKVRDAIHHVCLDPDRFAGHVGPPVRMKVNLLHRVQQRLSFHTAEKGIDGKGLC